jgi:hypothetical protein
MVLLISSTRVILLSLWFAALAIGLTLAGCQRKPENGPDMVKRGQYLVAIGACNDCHTPFKMGPQGPEPDMSRMLSGHRGSLVMPPPPKLPEGLWLWRTHVFRRTT